MRPGFIKRDDHLGRLLTSRPKRQRRGFVGSALGCLSSTVEETNRDIGFIKAALEQTTATEAFMAAMAPGTIEHWERNEYYKTDEEFVFAIARRNRRTELLDGTTAAASPRSSPNAPPPAATTPKRTYRIRQAGQTYGIEECCLTKPAMIAAGIFYLELEPSTPRQAHLLSRWCRRWEQSL